MALGLRAAFRRALRAIWPSCSRVSPNSCIRRWATRASQLAADTAPKGSVHCRKPEKRGIPPSPPPLPPMPARPPEPWAVDSVTVR